MITTNLSTKPFYNERAVHIVLALLGIAAVTVMSAGAVQLVKFSQENTALTATADEAERETARIEAEIVNLERGIGDSEIEILRGAAEEANRLIDQRVFSWTEFFNVIERTLPASVMLTAVRPSQTEEGTHLELAVIGRRVSDIDEFIERLEATGSFIDVLARQEELTDAGMYRAELSGQLLSFDLTNDGLVEPASES